MSVRYRIDYSIHQIDDDGTVTDIAWGGTSSARTIKEAAYELESQLSNEEWYVADSGSEGDQ